MPASIRRTARFIVAGTLHYGGVLGLWRVFRRKVLRRREVCVLGLHRVLTSEEQSRSNSLPAMVVSDATFERLLEYLQRRFRLISVETFLRCSDNDKSQTKPACMITFDDGWRDTFSTAYPMLERLGVPATVLVTTGVVGQSGGFWVERLRRCGISSAPRALKPPECETEPSLETFVEWLKRMPGESRERILSQILRQEEPCETTEGTDPMLTWDQVVEMSRDGVEIGAHTVNHPLLSYEDDATVERELLESKRTLEDKIGKPVRVFAYPNGDWDDRVRRRVQSAGYSCAFTTRPEWFRPGTDVYAVPRILLHESNITGPKGKFSPAMLELTLTGWR